VVVRVSVGTPTIPGMEYVRVFRVFRVFRGWFGCSWYGVVIGRVTVRISVDTRSTQH